MFRTTTTDVIRARRSPITRILGSALIATAATVAVATPARTATVDRAVAPTAQSAAVSYWGAISVSPSTGSTGYSYDYPGRTAAINAATGRCGKRDCRNIAWVANGCAAVAQAPNGDFGGGAAATLAEAKRQAIKGSGSSRATVYGWICTTGHR